MLTRDPHPIGVRKDGRTPRYHYTFSNEDGMGGVIDVGDLSGVVSLSDGTVYDLTPEVIEHRPEHHDELKQLTDAMKTRAIGAPVIAQ